MRLLVLSILTLCLVTSCTEQEFIEVNDCHGLSSDDYYQMYEGLQLLDNKMLEGGFETHEERLELFSSLMGDNHETNVGAFVEIFNLSQNDISFLNEKLGEYLHLLQDEQFITCFKNWVANQPAQDSSLKGGNEKGLLAGIASILGAGDCVTGPLNVVDTAIHIAVGVLTAPTGISAVLNWGAAVVSYGLAMKEIRSCITSTN